MRDSHVHTCRPGRADAQAWVGGWVGGRRRGGRGCRVAVDGWEGEGRRRGLTAIMMSVVMDNASLSLEDPTTLQPCTKSGSQKRVCGDIALFVCFRVSA
jgi:hypothetical protein